MYLTPALPLHQDHALFLDMDGTLLDIAPTAQNVVAPSALIPLLSQLCKALDGALAIVTGRTVADVDRLLTPLKLPVAGVHGAEIRFDPASEITAAAKGLNPSTIAAVHKIGRIAPGVIVEPKGAAIAVHYRLAEAHDAALEAEMRGIAEASGEGVELCLGRKVIELLPGRISKGAALKAFMSRAPFAGRRPIMIGDDVTDRSALDAAEQFGGLGLRVAGECFQPGDADFDSPGHVIAWLSSFVAGLER